jgi:hypothetical protein
MAPKLTRPRDPGLAKAITAAGGVTALARALGIDPAAVCRWTRVPTYRAAEVERITGMPLSPSQTKAHAETEMSEQPDMISEAEYNELSKLDLTLGELRTAVFVFVLAAKHSPRRKDFGLDAALEDATEVLKLLMPIIRTPRTGDASVHRLARYVLRVAGAYKEEWFLLGY